MITINNQKYAMSVFIMIFAQGVTKKLGDIFGLERTDRIYRRIADNHGHDPAGMAAF